MEICKTRASLLPAFAFDEVVFAMQLRTHILHTDADKTVKVPAWLNDPTLYHNRGDSTFAGESAELRRLRRARRPVHRAARGRRRHGRTSTRRGSTSASTASASTPSSTSTWSSGRSSRRPMLAHAKADRQRRLLHVRRGVRRQPGLHEPVHDDRHAARHARLRLPGQRARLRPGQGDDRAARLLRRRRLLHRHRLQRLRAADVPRQPRHGPDRHDAQATAAPPAPTCSTAPSSPTR